MRRSDVLGRLSPAQAESFGRSLTRGCGYLGYGPVYVVFNLPRWLQKADPPPVRPISLDAIGMRRPLRSEQTEPVSQT